MDRVDSRASSMGVTVPEYIRFVLLHDLNDVGNIDDIDRELLKDLPQAIDDVNNGRVVNTHSLEEALEVLRNHKEYD